MQAVFFRYTASGEEFVMYFYTVWVGRIFINYMLKNGDLIYRFVSFQKGASLNIIKIYIKIIKTEDP